MGIEKDKRSSADAAELRRHAEERLLTKKAPASPPRTGEETQKLVHELEVHQVELEMQNDELRQARDQVEKALEKYTDLFDFAPVGYFTLDRGGVISDVNLSGAGLLGVERTRLIGRRFGQFVRSEHRIAFNQFLGTVFDSRSKKEHEAAFLSKENVPLMVQIEAVAVASGQECRIAAIDITARRQAEEALRESEDRIYKLAEMAADAIILLDDHGKVTFCNTAAERLFGCPGTEITHCDFHQSFIPESLRTTAKRGFERFREQGAGPLIGRTTEVTALRKDGTEFPLELSISAVSIKGKWHAIAIMRDVTERRQAADEILDAREYAENIVETVRRPLVVLNADLKIISANQSFYSTFKTTPEEAIGNFIHDLGNRQWDIPKLRELFEAMLSHDVVFNSYEIEHTFPVIGRKIILLNARRIFQKKSGAYIILLAMEDITERKHLETEIQDAREYAESIVETVREPLVVLNSDLQVLTANRRFYDTFKVTPGDTIGNFIYDLGNRQWDIPRLRVLFEAILPHDAVFNGYEVEHDFQGIGRKVIRLNARQIFRKNIGSRIILLAMEDITERKLAAEKIGEVIRQQQAILDNIPNMAWLKDRKGDFVAVNEPFGKAFGKTPKDLVGKCVHDIYSPDLAAKYEKDSREVMATGLRKYFEESIVGRDGNVHHVEKVETPIFNDAGTVIGIIGIAHDITSRKETELTLRHESTHDMLTGLYNRAFFEEELERLAQGRMFPLSIVMADVNGLKTVNDTRGHEAGDELIRMAARIILQAFRAEDIVARLGGDEFAVILPATNQNVAEETVKRILSCPEIRDGLVSIAFGVASAENKDQLPDTLKLSDERMYRDKSGRKGS